MAKSLGYTRERGVIYSGYDKICMKVETAKWLSISSNYVLGKIISPGLFPGHLWTMPLRSQRSVPAPFIHIMHLSLGRLASSPLLRIAHIRSLHLCESPYHNQHSSLTSTRIKKEHITRYSSYPRHGRLSLANREKGIYMASYGVVWDPWEALWWRELRKIYRPCFVESMERLGRFDANV